MDNAFVSARFNGPSGPDRHQIEAAVLRSPIARGVILVDELSFGMTIEASLVMGMDGPLPAALCKD